MTDSVDGHYKIGKAEAERAALIQELMDRQLDYDTYLESIAAGAYKTNQRDDTEALKNAKKISETTVRKRAHKPTKGVITEVAQEVNNSVEYPERKPGTNKLTYPKDIPENEMHSDYLTYVELDPPFVMSDSDIWQEDHEWIMNQVRKYYKPTDSQTLKEQLEVADFIFRWDRGDNNG